MSKELRIYFFILLAIALTLLFPKTVFAFENGDFESEAISPWESYSGASAGISREEIHEGNYSVKVLNDSTTAVGIQQLITGIIGSRTYTLSGYTKITDSNIGKTLLRIAWYSSSDGSGGQMSAVDSASVTGVGDWRKIEVAATAPSEANSAKIRAVVSSTTGGVQAFAYFDDFSFEEVMPTPALTLIPTQVPPTSTTIPANTPVPISYDNIFISEFMADPESGDEWVELYNDNDLEVDLFGWYLDDQIGDRGPYRIVSGKISGKSYKKFSLESDVFLNNSGDDVRLLDGNQNEKDKKSYTSSTKGKSWSKDSGGNWCQTDPTPNAVNPNCSSPTATPVPASTPTSTSTPAPTIKPSLTPTKTPTPTISLSLTATPSGEVLGEEIASRSGLSQLSDEESKVSTSNEGENKRNLIFPAVAAVLGLAFIGFSIFSFLKGRRPKEEQAEVVV